MINYCNPVFALQGYCTLLLSFVNMPVIQTASVLMGIQNVLQGFTQDNIYVSHKCFGDMCMLHTSHLRCAL